MPEPLQLPADRAPVASTGNVTRSPVTTIAAVLAAIAQYLAINGAEVPQNRTGWVSFALGVIMAGVGALIRDPKMLTRTSVLICAMSTSLVLGSCSAQRPVTPEQQEAFVAAASGLALGGCVLLKNSLKDDEVAKLNVALNGFAGVLRTHTAPADIRQALLLLDPALSPFAESIALLLDAATANIPGSARDSVWYAAARGIVEMCAASPPLPVALGAT